MWKSGVNRRRGVRSGQALCLVLAYLVLAIGAVAQEEAEPLLPGWSPWTPLYSAQGGAGFRDNVLLSSFDRQSSAFLRGSLELFLSRFPVDGRAVEVYLFWEHTQYLEDVEVEREQLGFAHVQLKKDLGSGASARLELAYSHQNQVVDVSVTEAELTIIQVRGHGLAAEPSYRVELPGGSWLKVGIPLFRQFYEKPLDDYWEFGPKIFWGRDYGHESHMEWSYGYIVRDYDAYTALTSEGMSIPGTTRGFQQHEALWEWVHFWDETQHWQSTTRLSWRGNQDQGSGYFDYDRYRIYHRLRYRAKPWTWSVRGRVSDYQYGEQTVSLSDSDKRRRIEFSVTVRGEREITDHLSLFAEYGGEWITGNIRSEEYRVGTVLAGVLWEF